MPIDVARQKRLIQLLGMLGSDHDGEALNAARLAYKLIKDAQITWEEAFTGNVYNEEFVHQVASKSYHEGVADGKAAVQGKNKTFASYATTLISDHAESLSHWEYDFCLSWTKKKGRPTEKQLSIFIRLSEKTGESLGDLTKEKT